MGFSDKHSLYLPLLLFFLHVLFFMSTADHNDLPKLGASNKKVSAVLVFGDSTVDPGNNNNLSTVFKSNFLPYGRDFATGQMPTGRFTDGRLTTDFVASYVGVKEYLPAYLDSTLSIQEMMTGVSFASGGSGYDPLTPRLSNVIPISKQLQYFGEYKKRLESANGKQRTEDHINKAIFIISAGTNDFVVNYFSVPIRRQSFTVPAYHQFLLQHLQDFIQGLCDGGARRIAVVGLPPIGCLPIVVSLFSNSAAISQRGCIEQYSAVARDYNLLLQNQLNLMRPSLANHGARVYYVDIYGPLIDMIQSPGKFGFDKVNVGCCGTGYVEASLFCNPTSYVCSDASKYVFWDSTHPTEKAYHNLFNGIRSTVDLIVNT